MSKNTKENGGAVDDFDLLMLYYGEHENPQLAARVAADAELSVRLQQLSQDLAAIENAPLARPADDYGRAVWQKLLPELGGQLNQPAESPPWYQQLFMPRFSMAGLGGALALALFAFIMGQQMGPAGQNTLALDSQALLVRELETHLQQAELLLTEVANTDAASLTVSSAAQPLLRANRLYRIAGGSKVSPQLSQLLLDMETLLLQIANASSGEDLAPLAQYVDEDLLFRVRTLRSHLSDDRNSRI